MAALAVSAASTKTRTLLTLKKPARLPEAPKHLRVVHFVVRAKKAPKQKPAIFDTYEKLRRFENALEMKRAAEARKQEEAFDANIDSFYVNNGSCFESSRKSSDIRFGRLYKSKDTRPRAGDHTSWKLNRKVRYIRLGN